jgi:uncharacterized protein (TIGR01777 family)
LTYKQLNIINKILITGGSGYVGSHLTTLLLQKGYKVSHLSESRKSNSEVPVYSWTIETGSIDKEALEDIDCIVHLAGVSIGKRRWNKTVKQEIIESRVKSARLIYDTLSGNDLKLKAFISASAVGYYGSSTYGKIFLENDPPSNDFLGNTCNLWEKTADLFADSAIRTVKIRTGIVIGKNAVAFEKLYKPARSGFVIRLGNGRQSMPWIHITDLCNIYLKAIEDENLTGPYNAVAPDQISHEEFIRVMAGLLHRTVILPPVPSMFLKIILGEMSNLLLNGNPVSSDKISESGYLFVFPEIGLALNDIINNY